MAMNWIVPPSGEPDLTADWVEAGGACKLKKTEPPKCPSKKTSPSCPKDSIPDICPAKGACPAQGACHSLCVSKCPNQCVSHVNDPCGKDGGGPCNPRSCGTHGEKPCTANCIIKFFDADNPLEDPEQAPSGDAPTPPLEPPADDESQDQ